MSGAAPEVVRAPVASRRAAGDYMVLGLEASGIAGAVEPGQFVSIAMDAGARCILRRPFSVSGAEGGRVEVVFDAIGPGTRWLAARGPGEALDVVGPLGRPFALAGDGPALLVGGGYGAAPLLFAAQRLRAAGRPAHLILGAATARRVLEPEAAGGSVRVTTVDGSRGDPGTVTDVMAEEAARTGATTVSACGPMAMLAAVSREAQRLSLPCEVAVEEFMACGIGICWTCVLPVRVNGRIEMLRSCTEGPVFEGTAVGWR